MSPVRVWVALSGVCGALDTMIKYTQKQLREMVKNGIAVDVSNATSRSEAVPEDYKKIGYSLGVYGKNGLLLQGCESGKLYAVTARSSAVFMF